MVTKSLTMLTVTRGGVPFGAATRPGETAREDSASGPLTRRPARRARASARVSIATTVGLRLHFLEERAVLAVPLLFELRDGNESERGRVDAVAQTGRARTIRKQMPEMRIRAGRAHFYSPHAVRGIAVLADVGRLEGTHEARPTRPRVELVGRREQGLARHHVHVDSGLVVIPELVVEGRLGGAALRDLVLLGSESALELGVGRLAHGVSSIHVNPRTAG